MNERFYDNICQVLGATEIREIEEIQSLWSGYGKIARYKVIDGPVDSVVLKLVRFPNETDHPRGWNTSFSHERKVKSYQVESHWYSNYSELSTARLPKCFATDSVGAEMMLALEDLDAVGFSKRLSAPSIDEMFLCLTWLAEFHASFMGKDCSGLWEKGTYWHLDTRPDELEVLDDLALKAAAQALDDKLENCRFKTVVHGDAKLANFCFAEDSSSVAAVDFQYVGGGCGMKDLAYFVGSCLREDDCERFETILLDRYFLELKKALQRFQPHVDPDEVEDEWRSLYPVAWTDFHRFIKGWSPGHWKVHSYSERIARQVLERLRV
ncbi:phosphotransferase [Pelagicoccus albus]|uniref:Phosphotransferase n=1 Tax=Pelagicoccus albus TaxID=415222 RepID=A0A7X1E7M8_9BACT|nr:phosphotransferase [Pelagicoccus albus]MBC2605361.1 phosphotransferase [Pelagicoccus albus]